MRGPTRWLTRLGCWGAAAALLAASVGSPAGGSTRAAAAVAPLGTPLLSARRAPGWIEESFARTRLDATLKRILDQAGAQVLSRSCLLVTQGDFVLFAYRADHEVLPASNMKLLTATAALQKLGNSARITTAVTAAAAPVDGTVHGDLYLVGGGDPLLFTPQFDAEQDPPEPLYTSLPKLAERVRAAGIRRVDGSVLGDEDLFDTERGVPSWKPSYETEGDVGPLSALEVNNGFRLSPPYGPAPQPAVLAAQVFTQLLRAAGVTVTGIAGKGTSPATAHPVTGIESAPLWQVVDAILRVSDDTGAELLTKLLGKRFAGEGSTAAGVAVIRSTLAADGFPVSQLHGVDGSGLSRDDRVSCNLVADVLRHAGAGSALFDGLPVAAETGTLASRMGGTAAAGRLHAKTGTLDGVSALSGFVLPAPKTAEVDPDLATPLVFSLILNGLPPTWLGVEIGDEVGEALAAFPDALPQADVVPSP